MPPVTVIGDPSPPGKKRTRLELRRREALKFLASGAAFTVVGCTRPDEEIIPYVDMPEHLVPGEPDYYATALPLAGYARGVIVQSVDGRPIKIAGNPRHPASLGSTDIFGEAAVLSLYDPDRSKSVRGAQPISTWNSFFAALRPRLAALDETGGEGLRLVTGRVTSPTLLRQIGALLERYPGARWHSYEPAEGDLATMPTRRRQSLAEADVIVSLDADPLGPGPDQIINGREFASRRNPQGGGSVVRLYAIESTHTLTGANADHRLALNPAQITEFARALIGRSGGARLPDKAARMLDAIRDDVHRAGQRAVVLAGATLPAGLQAAFEETGRIERLSDPRPAPLTEFWRELQNGDVNDLVMLDVNPVYDFPDLTVARLIEDVPFAVHAGTHPNETAGLCEWHLPLSHPLESWSDLSATDGTVSIVQPLIRPLYNTLSSHEILANLNGEPETGGYGIVRETWMNSGDEAGFAERWREALLSGVMASSPTDARGNSPEREAPADDTETAEGFVAVIRPDPTIFDGSMSNNAWLQECPKPLTKHTWSNVISLSPSDAQRIGVTDSDVVLVESPEGGLEGPVHVDNAQADGVIGLTLGYGRSGAGEICEGLGYNARRLSPNEIRSVITGIAVRPTGRRADVPSTQEHFRLEGELGKLLPIVTQATDFAFEKEEVEARDHFIHADPSGDGYAWGMVIDNAACIGCNACVIACQSENNIPVVGPEEVANARIMHWLRVDRYEIDQGDDYASGFEPVPCMQCQKAPCEPVCPVEASVHDTEGLNNQVYNRCVGTRFCQSNCPYKVRKFNWYAYGSGQEYQNLGEDPLPARQNPEVTVRARGVMEKCTYCVQRISRARRSAKKTDEPIADGSVVTACQSACPTQAIRFGNLKDEKAEVTRARENSRHFTLLEELGTEPRTTYLARIRNAHPDLGKVQA